MQNSSYQGQMISGVPVTIADGQQSSSVIKLNGFSLVGVNIPAAFTGTAMTLEACDTEAGTYLPLKSTASGTAFSQTVAPSGYYAIDPALTQGVQFLKLKSGTAEGGARALTVSLKGI